MALKLWFADGVLGDQPRRFGSIFASNVFSGPTVRSDQRSEACGILKMDRLHAGNVGATELAGIEKFLAHAQVFLPQFDQFAPEILVEHAFIVREHFAPPITRQMHLTCSIFPVLSKYEQGRLPIRGACCQVRRYVFGDGDRSATSDYAIAAEGPSR